jgi:gliding motility-associated-like protein
LCHHFLQRNLALNGQTDTMKTFNTLLLASLFFFTKSAWAQCGGIGQTPATAFPVCGTSVFEQQSVPICTNRTIVTSCNDGAMYEDKNPYWYKFTCFTGGTLGFTIKPKTLSDDYDWQLFDITGQNPNDVYTNRNLTVCYNWSGEGGITGTSAAGTTSLVCAGFGQALFSSMPVLIQGHEYLLMISHFTDSQSGYDLEFSGGTGSITDPTLPALQEIKSGCGGTTIGIKLNKKMKCSSLAADGSDFSITPSGTITSATSVSCSNGFDMDSIILNIAGGLIPGNYTIGLKNGSDGNTLLDYCNRAISAGTNLSVTVFPVAPTPLDSIVPLRCAPDSLKLIFRKPILCNSIATNGSDFLLTGPGGNIITAAAGICDANGKTTSIVLKLNTAILVGGLYTLTMQQGIDGNTLLDECSQETPVGSLLSFTAYDTVSAAFNYTINYDCSLNTINLSHDGRNGVNQWTWSMDQQRAFTQNASFSFAPQSVKTIHLSVGNGICIDTSSQTVVVENALNASFTAPNLLCPEDAAVFTNTSTGIIDRYSWSFGNGATQSQRDATPQTYPPTTIGREKKYTVQLIVENNFGCADTATTIVRVLNTCYITVPNAFTPNGDGNNDDLYPLNAIKAEQLEFKVYNRLGQLIFSTTDWTKHWNGTYKGNVLAAGTFVWTLKYYDADKKKQVFLKGNTVLIR